MTLLNASIRVDQSLATIGEFFVPIYSQIAKILSERYCRSYLYEEKIISGYNNGIQRNARVGCTSAKEVTGKG